MKKRGDPMPSAIQILAVWLLILSSLFACIGFLEPENLLFDSVYNTSTKVLVMEYWHLTELRLLMLCKICVAFIAVLLYIRNIPKVAQSLRAKFDKKRGTAKKSAAEMYLEVWSDAITQEAVRRRIEPHNISMFDNNGLRPFVQFVLMVLGGIIVCITNSALLLPVVMLLDKLFKFKTMRFIICQTIGTSLIYTINEETLYVHYKDPCEHKPESQ